MPSYDQNRNITLGGIPLQLARSQLRQGMPSRPVARHQRGARDPQDEEPFLEVVPFGPDGMGYDLLPGNGFSYGLDTDAERSWGELAPGLLQGKVGLALDNPVVALEDTTPTSGSLGPSAPGTTADNSGIGTLTWASTSNATSSNDTYTTITTSGTSQTSHYLLLTNFGFAIPSGESVQGVIVRIEAKCSTGTVKLNARLVIGGTVQTGTTRSVIFGATSDLTLMLGGVADIFGQSSISESQGENSGFGIAIYTTENTVSGAVISVDSVTIQLIYSSSSDQKLLYIGGGAVMTKIDYQCAGTTVTFNTRETKTFSHATAPVITAIQSLKEGGAPSDAKLIVGFGASAPVAQVDAITPASTDIYRTQSTDPAYGGVFALAPGRDTTTTRVWKSTGMEDQAAGPFSKLQYAEVFMSTKDLTNQASWLPDTPHAAQVGDARTPINSLSEWQTDLAVGKPEGIYAWSANGSTNYLSLREYRSEHNGKHLTVWHQNLFCITVNDIIDYQQGNTPVGLAALKSNLSPVQGRPTAMAAFGKYLFVAYFDGTDTYIVKLTPASGGLYPYAIHPVTKIASYECKVMHAAVDENDVTFLFYATASDTTNKHDVGYCVVSPVQSRLYATGGTWFSRLMGEGDKTTTIQSITAYGVNLDASNHWTPALSWDGAAFAAIGDGSAINANGRVTKTTTAGANDSGIYYQLRLTEARSTTSNQPKLRALPVGDGPAGIIVEGLRQRAIDRWEISVVIVQNASTGYGGRDLDPVDVIYDQLLDMQGTVQPLIWMDHFGDTDSHSVIVQSVGYEPQAQDAELQSERRVAIRFADVV